MPELLVLVHTAAFLAACGAVYITAISSTADYEQALSSDAPQNLTKTPSLTTPLEFPKPSQVFALIFRCNTGTGHRCK